MCFGVKDALEMMRKEAASTQVTVRGELVHNPVVNGELKTRGYRVMGEGVAAIPETPKVLITAHGVSNAERERLRAAGKTLIDTTCPLVHKAHNAGLQLSADGYFVVVIGKRGHVEVVGLAGDLPRHVIIEKAEEVQRWENEKKILYETYSSILHS